VNRPPLYGDRTRWGLVRADALELLRQLPDASIDAVVTDPPYGIAFNNHHWDSGQLTSGPEFQRWITGWAGELRRILKPGGHLAAFGAPRTVHRLSTGIEDAGLEVRDQLLWLYGSGVPKGCSFEGQRGTMLKPAYEPVVLARAPLDGTTGQTLATWGTGVLHLGDAGRRDELQGTGSSRWPANVGFVHEAACTRSACVVSCAVYCLNTETGRPVSRFFYAAKASSAEREAGLDELAVTRMQILRKGSVRPRANIHPTVKPLSVMRWLVRLVTPPGGVVLDPFSGSASTGCAALLEGRQFLGIEREARYVEIARRRLSHWADA
jgi:DNA modification methylase